MFKKIFSLVSIIFFAVVNTHSQNSVVMEINGQKVTESEFLQIYLKNNDEPKYD